MAGHSKWKNIQHRKGCQDKKRAKIFTKIGLELQVASREGGEDPSHNPRLRHAIDKARHANMARDIIERNIKRGQTRGGSGDGTYKETVYECYGPGGVALIVECLTDNVNRTASEIRYIFSRADAQMTPSGSVGWMFEKRGYLLFRSLSAHAQSNLWEQAASLGADDIIEDQEDSHDDSRHILEVYMPAQKFAEFRQKLGEFCDDHTGELIWYPTTTVSVSAQDRLKLQNLISSLEDNPDVQAVFDNSVCDD